MNQLTGNDREFVEFIRWRPEYDTLLELINEQHRGILSFLNEWYNEIRGGRLGEDVVGYMGRKCRYLSRYSKEHLRFEVQVLGILVEKHGYSEEEYQAHLQKHRLLIRELMRPLAEQIRLLADGPPHLLDNIAKESLRDIGKWWFGHIRTPGQGEASGPDHLYREFIRKLPPEQKLALLNDIIIFLDHATRQPEPADAREDIPDFQI